MQRVRDLVGEQPVRADHRRHVARLDRDLEVAVVEALEQAHLFERSLDERLGLVLLCETFEVLRQRAGVRADAHRGSLGLRRPDDLLDLVRASDVARVDANRGDPRVDRPQREARIEMNVGDHRDRREADDLRQRVRVLALRHRHAHDLAARAREGGDLRGRRLDVVRLGQRHRLHDRRRAASDLDAADRYRALAGHGARLPAYPPPPNRSFRRPKYMSTANSDRPITL